MSDTWLNIQHAEVLERNRQTRQAQMAEAQRLAGERQRQADERNRQGRRS